MYKFVFVNINIFYLAAPLDFSMNSAQPNTAGGPGILLNRYK